MDDAQRACLARLQEMDAAWRERLERDDLELSQLSEGLREISRMMDALTARLLLAPWDGPPRTGSKS